MENDLSVQHYSSNRSIILSDHYPVSAFFILNNATELTEQTNSMWKCLFEPIPKWTSDIPFVCRFTFIEDFYSKSGSYADWVGVYKNAKMEVVSKPFRWVYMLTSCRDPGIINGVSKVDDSTMIVEFQSLLPGYYRMGYFSYYKNCLIGLSKVFKVEELNSNGTESIPKN